jgi:hypothetical protein
MCTESPLTNMYILSMYLFILRLVKVKLYKFWLNILKKYQYLEYNINIIRIIIKCIFILYVFGTMNVNTFCYIFSQTLIYFYFD